MYIPKADEECLGCGRFPLPFCHRCRKPDCPVCRTQWAPRIPPWTCDCNILVPEEELHSSDSALETPRRRSPQALVPSVAAPAPHSCYSLFDMAQEGFLRAITMQEELPKADERCDRCRHDVANDCRRCLFFLCARCREEGARCWCEGGRPPWHWAADDVGLPSDQHERERRGPADQAAAFAREHDGHEGQWQA